MSSLAETHCSNNTTTTTDEGEKEENEDGMNEWGGMSNHRINLQGMHQFQRYDPAQPRTVTSFKGNQKLIFEGYRYNIHHIVPAKGVKTWRCVCAKKLTCSRSWCKGRAETWDDDGQGISKGEHNHPAEHEVAELEYFKSQLILAAIASPSANLNDLIDEAVGFMSEGVSFGSRESLKKSLTVARKAAENGGFKLKCYKSSDKPFKSLVYNNIVQPQQHMQEQQPSPGKTAAEMPKKPMACGGGTPAKNGTKSKCQNTNMDDNDSNAHVMTLLSLAKQCRENRIQQEKQNAALLAAASCSPPSCRAPSAASMSLLDSSGFHSGGPSLNCSTTCPSPSPLPNSSSSSSFLFAAVAAAAAAAALNGNNKSSNNNSIHKRGGMALSGQKRATETEKTEAKLSPAIVGVRMGTNLTSVPTNYAKADNKNSDSQKPNGNEKQMQNAAQIVQRKKARVNSIFDRLSTKAAEAAAATKASSSAEESPAKGAWRDDTQFNVAETQTDREMRFSTAEHRNKSDSWRVVRICCCGDRAKCTRGLKRRRSASPAEAGDFGEDVMPMATPVEEPSPPPSASSSVENQPQQNGTMAEEEFVQKRISGANAMGHGKCCE